MHSPLPGIGSVVYVVRWHSVEKYESSDLILNGQGHRFHSAWVAQDWLFRYMIHQLGSKLVDSDVSKAGCDKESGVQAFKFARRFIDEDDMQLVD